MTDSAGTLEHPAPGNPDAAAILEAVMKRNSPVVSVPGRTPRISRDNDYEAWDANNPVRQEFRRLLNREILRNNDKKDARMALKVLNEITENILKNPDDPKYRRLPITSKKMNQHIMPRKGTVEFLQRSGFRRQTEGYVTRLVFNTERMNDLRIGAQCLDEVIKSQIQATEDEERAKRQEAANKKAAVTKVLNAFRNDRQTVAAREERERLARERGDTQAEAENVEPPVDEMSKLKIKTLSDCS